MYVNCTVAPIELDQSFEAPDASGTRISQKTFVIGITATPREDANKINILCSHNLWDYEIVRVFQGNGDF